MNKVSEEQLAAERELQSVINARHRLEQNPDFKLLRAHSEKFHRTHLTSFLVRRNGTYDPLAAAMRDGQRSVFIHWDELLACVPTGPGNIIEPKVSVKKPRTNAREKS